MTTLRLRSGKGRKKGAGAVGTAFPALFFALALSSCLGKNVVELAGTWKGAVVYEQEFAEAVGGQSVAAVRLSQENIFEFGADGNFTRKIRNKNVSVRPLRPLDAGEEGLRSLYAAEYTLFGTYELSGNVLTLCTESVLSGGERVPYGTFFEETQAFGEPESRIVLEIPSKDEILIQGIPFRREE